jgi:23S rRNA (uridine2552-2'-O)-methyltransferase
LLVTRQWRADRKRDKFYRLAKREHYRSRAVYKLKQLDHRFDLMHQGDTIVDLGASPGGWSQVAVEMGGPESKVFALDLVRFVPIEGVTFIKGDIRDEEIARRLTALVPDGVDVVISDMAPNISGSYTYDHARSIELCEHALAFASKVLRDGGNFVAKMFSGDMSNGFVRRVGGRFCEVHVNRPRATREQSSEEYVIGLDFVGVRGRGR